MQEKQLNVTVLGVGAVGGVLASHLLEQKHHITLCSKSEMKQLQVHHQTKGKIVDKVVSIQTQPQANQPQDILFISTKAHHTRYLGPWLKELVDKTTMIVVVQNGVEHVERVEALLPHPVTILPVVIDCPAIRPAKGVIELRRDATLMLPPHTRSQEIVDLFQGCTYIQPSIAPNFQNEMWRKLCVNVISGAIPAVSNMPGRVFHFDEIQALARKVVRECWQVATAESATLQESVVDEIVNMFKNSSPSSINSMLKDRREGKTLEVDARNGAVVRLGAKHGIPTPYNETLLALLSIVNQTKDED